MVGPDVDGSSRVTQQPTFDPPLHGGHSWCNLGPDCCGRAIRVRRNPWIEDVTDKDLVAQYEFGMRIRERVDAANGAVTAIRGLETELAAYLEGVDAQGLTVAAEWLGAARDEVENGIYPMRNPSNRDSLNFPITVSNRIANLVSRSEREDGSLTTGTYAVFGIMVERWERSLGALEIVSSDPWTESNANLARFGMVATASGRPSVCARVSKGVADERDREVGD